MAQQPPPTHHPNSEPTLQGRPVEELEWFDVFMDYLTGSQNPEDGNAPASADIKPMASPVRILGDVAPDPLATQSGTLLTDPISQATALDADAEALFAQLKHRIINSCRSYEMSTSNNIEHNLQQFPKL